jgi:hypothetical protein
MDSDEENEVDPIIDDEDRSSANNHQDDWMRLGHDQADHRERPVLPLEENIAYWNDRQ